MNLQDLASGVECSVCRGFVCKGGNNTRCLRRNPHASHVAIILDTYGGARTIVADKRSMRANVAHDEMVRVVPNYLIHEPIAWEQIPGLVALARTALEQWLDTRPNLDELQQQIVTMWRLRCLENPKVKRSLDLSLIAQT